MPFLRVTALYRRTCEHVDVNVLKGKTHVSVTGATNVKANGTNDGDPRVQHLYVPASNDSSQAMGRFMLGQTDLDLGKVHGYRSYNRSLRRVSGIELLRGRARSGMRRSTIRVIGRDLSRLKLASGGIVARAVGRAEFGARFRQPLYPCPSDEFG